MYPLWAKNPGVQQETAVAWVRRMSHMMVQASSQAARMHLPEKNYGILVKVRACDFGAQQTLGHSSIPLPGLLPHTHQLMVATTTHKSCEAPPLVALTVVVLLRGCLHYLSASVRT